MMKLVFGLGGVGVGAVAMFLATGYISGLKQKPTATPTPTSMKTEEESTSLPTDAHFAIVSGNGRVVVVVDDDKTLVVIRDGKISGTVKGLRARCPRMALNHDGSRLVAHDIRRHGVVLWNTVEGAEVAFYATTQLNITPQFSPGGNLFGFTVDGQEHLDLYYANTGVHAVKLAGNARLHTFVFTKPGATSDDNLVVSLLSEERSYLGYKYHIQWQWGTYGWSRLERNLIYALPDDSWDKD